MKLWRLIDIMVNAAENFVRAASSKLEEVVDKLTRVVYESLFTMVCDLQHTR